MSKNILKLKRDGLFRFWQILKAGVNSAFVGHFQLAIYTHLCFSQYFQNLKFYVALINDGAVQLKLENVHYTVHCFVRPNRPINYHCRQKTCT